jgi:hypothetical protein
MHSLLNIAAKPISTQMAHKWVHAGKPVLRRMHSQDSDISSLIQYSETQPEYDTTAPSPHHCTLAFSLAWQPRRSARVCPEHARWSSPIRVRTPGCPPALRPEGAFRLPVPPLAAPSSMQDACSPPEHARWPILGGRRLLVPAATRRARPGRPCA